MATMPDITHTPGATDTADLRTKTLDFGGFDSSRILILRGGTLMSIGSFPESSSQQILVGRVLVGRSSRGPWTPAAWGYMCTVGLMLCMNLYSCSP